YPSAGRSLAAPFAFALPVLGHELLSAAPPLHDGVAVPVYVEVGVLDEDYLQARRDSFDRFEDQLEHLQHVDAIVIGHKVQRTINVLVRREVDLRRLVEEDEVRDRSRALHEPLMQGQVRDEVEPDAV